MSVTGKVLIADDDQGYRTMLRDAFAASGYTVIEAVDGESALSQVQADHEFVAIVTDLKMPKMDGMEFAKRLMANPATKNALMIVLTSVSNDYMKTAVESTGIKHYLVKDEVMPQQLVEMVQTLANGGD